MRKALYAGSFDPITLGHEEIINAATKDFDLVVALVQNPLKPSRRIDKRSAWVSIVCQKDVLVVNYLRENILTVDIARELGASVLVRGIKGVTNIEEELQLAFNNSILAPEIQTVFYPVSQKYYHISSTAVRVLEQCFNGEKYRDILRQYLPECIIDDFVDNKEK